MDFKNRLKLIEQTYIDKQGIFRNPKYSEWSTDKIKNYIKEHIDREFSEHLITDMKQARSFYKMLNDNGTINEDEMRTHIKCSQEYFAGSFN